MPRKILEKFRDRPRKKFRVSLISNIKCSLKILWSVNQFDQSILKSISQISDLYLEWSMKVNPLPWKPRKYPNEHESSFGISTSLPGRGRASPAQCRGAARGTRSASGGSAEPGRWPPPPGPRGWSGQTACTERSKRLAPRLRELNNYSRDVKQPMAHIFDHHPCRAGPGLRETRRRRRPWSASRLAGISGGRTARCRTCRRRTCPGRWYSAKK